MRPFRAASLLVTKRPNNPAQANVVARFSKSLPNLLGPLVRESASRRGKARTRQYGSDLNWAKCRTICLFSQFPTQLWHPKGQPTGHRPLSGYPVLGEAPLSPRGDHARPHHFLSPLSNATIYDHQQVQQRVEYNEIVRRGHRTRRIRKGRINTGSSDASLWRNNGESLNLQASQLWR